MATEETDGGTAAPETVTDTSQEDAALLASLDEGKTEAAPSVDADFVKRLESMDPTTLPEAVRRKIEAPFLSDYTKKTQAIAEDKQKVESERQALLNVIDRLTARPGQPDPTAEQKKELLERLQSGDQTVLESLMEMKIQEKMGPQMEFITQDAAIRTAGSLEPSLPQYEKNVAEILTQDPDLRYLCKVDNHRFAPKILAGIARSFDRDAWKDKATKLEASIPEIKKAAVEEWKAKVRGLPTSTSQAGRGPSAKTTEDLELRDILRSEYEAHAGRG